MPVASRFDGSGRTMTATPARPTTTPTMPTGERASAGTSARANPVLRTGERLTRIAAAAAVVCCWPTNRKAW